MGNLSTSPWYMGKISLLTVNLQLFAGEDKTEKATPKKREEARKKGQVLQSREINATLVLISLFVGLKIFGPMMYSEVALYFRKIFELALTGRQEFTVNHVMNLFIDVFLLFLKVTGPLMAFALITGLISGYAQVGFLFTFETLGFKFNKINPLNGIKRMFSMHSAFELIKSMIKMIIVGYIAYSYIKGEAENILDLLDMEILEIGVYISSLSLNVALRICLVLFILGVFDYAYQWWDYEKNLKMSKQEIKEEYKQTEGNPQIKSKIREKQKQISMRRMLQDVPNADVVITNPTHFAIALKYDQEKSAAPVCLAKGQDYMALRIREIAKENKVELVENKPLARSLYESVEIGEAIPPELYQAVAEILAFVYKLKGVNAR